MLIDCSVESKEKRDQGDDKIMFDTLIRKKVVLFFLPLVCACSSSKNCKLKPELETNFLAHRETLIATQRNSQCRIRIYLTNRIRHKL